jgi:hypothetical protein
MVCQHLYQNLLEIEHLDLSRPYWAQGFNEAASIGEALYMWTGAAALTLYRYMFVTFFNKDMIYRSAYIDAGVLCT